MKNPRVHDVPLTASEAIRGFINDIQQTHFTSTPAQVYKVSAAKDEGTQRPDSQLVRCILDPATKPAQPHKKREIISGGVNEIPNERRGTPGRRL